MTDLEITRLCASAMDYPIRLSALRGMVPSEPLEIGFGTIYDPLHDDAQAMALVKKFGLRVDFDSWGPTEKSWCISVDANNKIIKYIGKDLNRAICECVAKMQQAEKLKKLSAFHRHGCPMHEADMTEDQAYNAACP